MFCVECGKETEETFDGLCIECYVKGKKFFDIPSVIDVTVCRNCGAYKIESGWAHGELDELIRTFLEGHIRHEDIKNFRVAVGEDGMVTCTGEFHGFPIHEEGLAEVKIKNSICETCSRMKGGYFEAVLQIRKQGGRMSERELKLSDDVVYKKSSEYPEGYVSKRDIIHGGVDYYIGDKKMAASAARILSDMFRGESNVSTSLVGMKDGREVYRNTYIVRIPEYSRGGYVEIDGRVYRVLDIGKRVVLMDMESGDRKYFYRNEMSRAKVMDVEEVEAVVVSEKNDELQVLDPENYRTVVLSKPQDMKVGETIKVVKWKGRMYLAGD